ncbi:MAG: glutamine--tRNA ligase/YqeY domain fusion protein [Panacagrimonas sp.]
MSESEPTTNFLRNLIRDQLQAGEHPQGITTRFPPEPNGYLHVGHAKAICLNFGLAQQFGGTCNLRLDDTNPEKENQEYIDAILEDVDWLGFQVQGKVRHASDYFQTLYDWAVDLIKQGLAYVDHQTPEEARINRGNFDVVGKNSRFRDRSIQQNLDLFEQMRAGAFEEGACTLRAKIDMAAPNMNLRDPVLYRVRKAAHHQTGNAWCIYPSYDFAHGQSDAIEGVTHSICTLEFEDHRPLYEWFIEHLPVPSKPRQYEFARLNLSYTITSKRKLKQLVDEGRVSGWDDPRMPTIQGMRRRGIPAKALTTFCDKVGVSRAASTVDVALLEHVVREQLNESAPRAMCVIDPLKVVITNYPETQSELLPAPGHPSRDDLPARELPFTREIWIEREDFREQANKKYKRLVLGKKVRLRNAYVIIADECIKNGNGEITELRCRYEAETLGQDPADGVKPKGVIHWVSASHGVRVEARLYDRLFSHKSPDQGDADLIQSLNTDSLEIRKTCWAEPSLVNAEAEQSFQFERLGYFVADRRDHQSGHPVFNRTVTLRDTWARIEGAE